MPGMMDTILNLGLNNKTVIGLGKKVTIHDCLGFLSEISSVVWKGCFWN